jgi:Beta-lactamase class A
MKKTSKLERVFGYVLILSAIGCSTSTKMGTVSPVNSDTLLQQLFSGNPAYFESILQRKGELEIQVIYTQIDRDKKNQPVFTDHYFNLDAERYFYPASTVKFPVAILALQRLKELGIKELDKNTTMLTGSEGAVQTSVQNDPSAKEGQPTIAHYIKKILLVSDNDAFNRLYEFLGQDYINTALHRLGYNQAEIIHRLDIFLTEEENRHTNPIRFTDTSGKTIYEQAAQKSQYVYAPRDNQSPNYRRGKGFMRGDSLVNEPFDFSKKNRLTLPELHGMVKSIIFPEAVPKTQRFDLAPEDYTFLRRYMSMRPPESVSPVYDSTYGDNYVKMLFYGTEKTPALPAIRIFGKTGTAYGYLSESCYFVDFEHKTEFLLSAVIYCNSDGIFNDNKYDYTSTGYPFLKNLGRVIYEWDKKRIRKRLPDLSAFRFQYDN